MLGALRSLRWRLTLSYAALLAAVLAGLGAYQYVTLQRSLEDTRVSTLRGDLEDGINVLTRVAARRTDVATIAGARATRAALCTNVGTSDAAASVRGQIVQGLACAVETSSGRTVSVVVYDRALRVVASAFPQGTTATDVPRLDSGGLDQALGGETSAAQVVDTPTGGQLVVAFPVPVRGAAAGSIAAVAQLATSTQPSDDVLAAERNRLALAGAAALVVATLLGLLLTARALRGLRRLTETAGRLATGDLRARSRLQPRADEVGTLARAFDDMADRIEQSFAARAESEAQVRRFIADASHELRTPVTALKGYIEVMQRGAAREPEAMDAALAAMGREAERMRVLVLDLLTLARLDAQRPLTLQPLDLGATVAALLDEGVPGMPESLTRELPGTPVEVRADRNAVVTIVRNLLVNACKYAPGAAQRWRVQAVPPHAAVLEVHDDGPGIPAVDLPHVFERFYRGEKNRGREEGGSGLGLSIVQGLARAMGGDVSVESREGWGTTVRVTLPAP